MAPIGLAAGVADRLASHLSDQERARIGQFHHQDDRRRQLVARGLVREALAALSGSSPGGLSFTTTSRGKPRLTEPASLGGLHFNLSHSGDWVVLAVTSGSPVGVDIEAPGQQHLVAPIAERYFGPGESAVVRSASAEQQRDRFYRIWTVREAYLKALGSGLSGASGRDVLLANGRLADPRWQVWRLAEPSGYHGALVLGSGNWQHSIWLL